MEVGPGSKKTAIAVVRILDYPLKEGDMENSTLSPCQSLAQIRHPPGRALRRTEKAQVHSILLQERSSQPGRTAHSFTKVYPPLITC